MFQMTVKRWPIGAIGKISAIAKRIVANRAATSTFEFRASRRSTTAIVAGNSARTNSVWGTNKGGHDDEQACPFHGE